MERIIVLEIVLLFGCLLGVKGCDINATVADVVFLVDSSSSIKDPDFPEIPKFLENSVSAMQIGPDAVRMSLILFAARAHKVFGLDQYLDSASLISAINSTTRTYGWTDTYLGLKTAAEEFNLTAYTNNGNVTRPKTVVLLTDGKSDNKSMTVAEASVLKGMEVNIICVGVTKNVDRGELYAVATDHRHVIRVDDFISLQNILSKVLNVVCTDALFYGKTHQARSTITSDGSKTKIIIICSVVAVLGVCSFCCFLLICLQCKKNRKGRNAIVTTVSSTREEYEENKNSVL